MRYHNSNPIMHATIALSLEELCINDIRASKHRENILKIGFFENPCSSILKFKNTKVKKHKRSRLQKFIESMIPLVKSKLTSMSYFSLLETWPFYFRLRLEKLQEVRIDNVLVKSKLVNKRSSNILG